jgi:hypothetical protein
VLTSAAPAVQQKQFASLPQRLYCLYCNSDFIPCLHCPSFLQTLARRSQCQCRGLTQQQCKTNSRSWSRPGSRCQSKTAAVCAAAALTVTDSGSHSRHARTSAEMYVAWGDTSKLLQAVGSRQAECSFRGSSSTWLVVAHWHCRDCQQGNQHRPWRLCESGGGAGTLPGLQICICRHVY